MKNIDDFTPLLTNLEKNGFHGIVVETKDQALEHIKNQTPKDASVINGASRTLEEIGFVNFLKSGSHPWHNLHETILSEKDPSKQSLLRKQATVADYYFGSVHALTEEGEMLIASNSGSQLPSIAFNAKNLILVVGQQKIVPDIAAAFTRVQEVVIPLEDARMKEAYGYGTSHNKTLILHKENPALGRRVEVIIVKEHLGF